MLWQSTAQPSEPLSSTIINIFSYTLAFARLYVLSCTDHEDATVQGPRCMLGH